MNHLCRHTNRVPQVKGPALPFFSCPQPKQQAAKALEGLLLKALKAAAPTADRRAEVLQQMEQLALPLQAARAALGAA